MEDLTQLEFRLFMRLFWEEMKKRNLSGYSMLSGDITWYKIDEIECCKRIALAKMKG